MGAPQERRWFCGAWFLESRPSPLAPSRIPPVPCSRVIVRQSPTARRPVPVVRRLALPRRYRTNARHSLLPHAWVEEVGEYLQLAHMWAEPKKLDDPDV